MSDKLFKVAAKNHLKWASEGAIDAEYYVIAPDFIAAMVKAEETLSELRGKLAEHKSVDGLRIVTLSEVGDVVNGVVMEREPEAESWIDRTARKIKEQQC